jgi:amino acid adenylation domain-containing protein
MAIFAVLKADAVYVPLPSKLSRERVKSLVDRLRPAAIICDANTIELVMNELVCFETNAPKIIVLGHLSSQLVLPTACMKQCDVDERSVDLLPSRNIDVDIAQIIHTSGSTGVPKGVMVTHRSIIEYVRWCINYFQIRSDDKMLSTAPFHVDMSTFDIFASMAAGAKLCIASEEELLFPALLKKRLADEGITIWKGVASLAGLLARAGVPQSSASSHLSRVIFSGETLPAKHLKEWMISCPATRFFNGYGPTEATGISTVHELTRPPEDGEDIPIGRACDNKEVLLLNKHSRVLEPNTIGEICIRGSGVSPGYWGDREETEARFVKFGITPEVSGRLYKTGDYGFFDELGRLHFSGRRDDQIKYMGYRIELSEITRALLSLPYVADASALLAPKGLDGMDVIAAVLELSTEVGSSKIKEDLRGKLPGYMIPKLFRVVSRIPRSGLGKVDSHALRQLLSNGTS